MANNVNDDMTVELGCKEENEGRQRSSIDVATSSCTNDSVQPSLPIALQMLIDSALSLQSDSFIVLVTDGSSLDAMDVSTIRSQVEGWNSERTYLIHLLIVGIDISNGRQQSVLESLGNVSRSSIYLNASPDTLKSAFHSVSAIVNGRLSNQLISFLTMEKF